MPSKRPEKSAGAFFVSPLQIRQLTMAQAFQTLPFRHYGTVTRAATTSSANVALSRAGEDQTVIITAPADNSDLCYIAFGDDSVTADTDGFPILPGTVQSFSVPETVTHIAAEMASGTGTIYASVGEGL